MAEVHKEEMAAVPRVTPLADPAALGLGAFALTTFLLSVHNAFGPKTLPLLSVFGFAVFYGGLGQFLAGMFEFRNRNIFGATAFSTYGAFWMGVAAFLVLVVTGKVAANEIAPSLAWILVAFAIFNTYMLILSARVNTAVFLVFLTLEITEILLAWGNFNGDPAGKGMTSVGGYMGIITAIVAWYTSAATVANNQGLGRVVFPVGRALWGERTGEPAAVSAGAVANRPSVT